jgi:hypothetical protein
VAIRFVQQKLVALMKHVELTLHVVLQLAAMSEEQLDGLLHVLLTVAFTQIEQNGPAGDARRFGSDVMLQLVSANISETFTNEEAYVLQAQRF